MRKSASTEPVELGYVEAAPGAVMGADNWSDLRVVWRAGDWVRGETSRTYTHQVLTREQALARNCGPRK